MVCFFDLAMKCLMLFDFMSLGCSVCFLFAIVVEFVLVDLSVPARLLMLIVPHMCAYLCTTWNMKSEQ